MIARVLTLRIEQTENREAYQASLDEVGLSTVGVTANDALFVLGQCISSMAESCKEHGKDVMDVIPSGER